MNTSHPYSAQKAAYDKQWHDTHKPEVRAYRAKYAQHCRTTLKGRYAIFKNRAHCRQWRMEISFDQFSSLAILPCHYCGGDRSATLGLDRINSLLGYLVTNVRPCCRSCNLAKSYMTETEFKTWATALAKHWL